MNHKTRKKVMKAIAAVLAVIDTTDPEHPTFVDSGADSIDELVKLKGRLRKALNKLTIEHLIS